jgi:hypothetical protein
VERPKPSRVNLRIREQRLQKHEDKEHRCQTDDGPAHAPDDRCDEHQHRKAGEEKLDRNENKQPRKSGKRRVFGEVFDA